MMRGGAAAEGGDGDERIPVSPNGQFFNSSVLSVYILAVFELESPVAGGEQREEILRKEFLPVSTRFSSIMVKDTKGVKHWKPVKVNIKDHIRIPTFPPGLSPEEYEKHLQGYLSEIAIEEMSQNKPLWEVHIFKYCTPSAVNTLVFKLHHAIGDGFSLMTALFSCLRRADDPSLPLTFPSCNGSSKQNRSKIENGTIWRHLSPLWFTFQDFGWSLLKSSLLVDPKSPIRSGELGVEFKPVFISSISLSLEEIREVREELKATVNDVITGTVFYGIQLYMHRMSPGSENLPATALVLLNTRSVSKHLSLEDIRKDGAEASWGNQFGFIHVPLPACKCIKKANPIDYVFEAQELIMKKRSSLGVYLTGRFLEMLRRLRGPEAAAEHIHSTLRNTSMTISNIIGPLEKISMGGCPVKSFYFMVTRLPQSLTISMLSYMGKLRLAVGGEKGFLDSEAMSGCFEEAFAKILDAVRGKRYTPPSSQGDV
ncbi:wax ester synthase/diacylglycerol acyltransferase 4-like [Nymphaea colorata]|nr:wax ester synthase/diacylglycerol acyltransferase 4-like [Nymphaea colorata]